MFNFSVTDCIEVFLPTGPADVDPGLTGALACFLFFAKMNLCAPFR